MCSLIIYLRLIISNNLSISDNSLLEVSEITREIEFFFRFSVTGAVLNSKAHLIENNFFSIYFYL